MNAAYFRMLHGYNAWANRKLWDCIAPLTDDQFTQEVDFSHGAVRNQVLHVMRVELGWPSYLRGISFEEAGARWNQQDLTTRAAIRAWWETIETDFRAYLDSISDADLEVPFTVVYDGRTVTHIPAHILTQVITHSLDHRAQIMATLHRMGAATFGQDIFSYLDEQDTRQAAAGYGTDASPAYFRLLTDYNSWANRRFWDCLASLTEEQFTRDVDYSHGALRNHVLHTMGGEWFLIGLLRGKTFDEQNVTWAQWGMEDNPARAAIRARWDEIEAAFRAYVDSLTGADLDRSINYAFAPDKPRTNTCVELLTQTLYHSLDHRAQMMAVLHTMGAPTFSQDFIIYVEEEKA